MRRLNYTKTVSVVLRPGPTPLGAHDAHRPISRMDVGSTWMGGDTRPFPFSFPRHPGVSSWRPGTPLSPPELVTHFLDQSYATDDFKCVYTKISIIHRQRQSCRPEGKETPRRQRQRSFVSWRACRLIPC